MVRSYAARPSARRARPARTGPRAAFGQPGLERERLSGASRVRAGSARAPTPPRTPGRRCRPSARRAERLRELDQRRHPVARLEELPAAVVVQGRRAQRRVRAVAARPRARRAPRASTPRRAPGSARASMCSASTARNTSPSRRALDSASSRIRARPRRSVGRAPEPPALERDADGERTDRRLEGVEQRLRLVEALLQAERPRALRLEFRANQLGPVGFGCRLRETVRGGDRVVEVPQGVELALVESCVHPHIFVARSAPAARLE